MPQYFTAILLAVSGAFEVASGQCNSSPKTISTDFPDNSTEATINITSPNYPNEYGKQADCVWNLSSNEYNVEVTFRERQLHYEDSFGRPYCTPSYQIYVNGEVIDCLPEQGFNASCYHYYPSSCNEPNVNQGCSKDAFINTFHIAYKSDGRTDGNGNHTIRGFVMLLKFTKCSKSSLPSNATSVTETSTSTIGSTEPPSGGNSDSTVAIIVLGVVCAVLALSMMGVVICLLLQRSSRYGGSIKRRRNSNQRPPNNRPMNLPGVNQQRRHPSEVHSPASYSDDSNSVVAGLDTLPTTTKPPNNRPMKLPGVNQQNDPTTKPMVTWKPGDQTGQNVSSPSTILANRHSNDNLDETLENSVYENFSPKP